MATRIIDDSKLNDIAVAIQEKDNGGQMTVDDMPTRIENLPSGGGTLISKTIIENGIYNASSDNADGYSSVDVSVADKWAGLIDNTISGEVIIPDRVTTISDSKFKNCSRITELILPDTIITIGDYAFQYCTGIINLKILSNSFNSVRRYAFQGLNNLRRLDVKDLENWILSACGEFGTFTTAKPWDLYINGILAKNIDISTMPITKLYGFSYCASIETFLLPNSLIEVGTSLFQLCRSLKNIKIPASVKQIDSYAFQSSDALEFVDCTELTYTGTTVNTTLGSGVFHGTTCSIIFADEATMNIYKNATNWSFYASRMTYIGA